MSLADKVKNDVDAFPVCDFECFCCKVVGLVVDSVGGAVGDGEEPVELFLGGGGGDDVLPEWRVRMSVRRVVRGY